MCHVHAPAEWCTNTQPASLWLPSHGRASLTPGLGSAGVYQSQGKEGPEGPLKRFTGRLLLCSETTTTGLPKRVRVIKISPIRHHKIDLMPEVRWHGAGCRLACPRVITCGAAAACADRCWPGDASVGEGQPRAEPASAQAHDRGLGDAQLVRLSGESGGWNLVPGLFHYGWVGRSQRLVLGPYYADGSVVLLLLLHLTSVDVPWRSWVEQKEVEVLTELAMARAARRGHADELRDEDFFDPSDDSKRRHLRWGQAVCMGLDIVVSLLGPRAGGEGVDAGPLMITCSLVLDRSNVFEKLPWLRDLVQRFDWPNGLNFGFTVRRQADGHETEHRGAVDAI